MSRLEATTEYVSADAARSEGSFAPKAGVVNQGQPKLATETQALLRVRLRAATFVLFLGYILFFIRNVLLPHHILKLALLHATVLLVQGSAMVLLWSRRPVSLRRLRQIEVVVFGLSVVFIAAAQYRVILLYALANDATMSLAMVKSSVMYVLCLIAVYGTFIPNHWRRAAAVIVPIALTPALVMTLLRIAHPELRPVAMRIVSFEQISDNVLILGLGALTSILGTHIINTLRNEAFEARQLGQYRLGERIGAGGMGEVYLAEHQLLKRPCAIKLIRPGNADDPRALARFEREVRATAHLSHWNTVEIFDYGRTEDGTFYYVMEYLPGLSLADLVEKHGPASPRARDPPAAAGLQCPPRGARGGPDPPRHQACQHLRRAPRGPRRRDQAARLRPGQARLRVPFRGPLAGGVDHRVAPLHVARAGDRQPGPRRPQRHLLAGRRGLLFANRSSAIRRRQRNWRDDRARPRRRGPPLPARGGGPGRPRAGRASLPGQGSGRPLPRRRVARTGTGRVSGGRRMDPGACGAVVEDAERRASARRPEAAPGNDRTPGLS